MDDRSRAAAYRLVVATILADGVIRDAEEEFLAGVRGRLGIDDAQRRELTRGLDVGVLPLEEAREIAEPEDRQTLLRLCAEAASSDGEVSRTERLALQQIATALGLDEAALKAALRGAAPR